MLQTNSSEISHKNAASTIRHKMPQKLNKYILLKNQLLIEAVIRWKSQKMIALNQDCPISSSQKTASIKFDTESKPSWFCIWHHNWSFILMSYGKLNISSILSSFIWTNLAQYPVSKQKTYPEKPTPLLTNRWNQYVHLNHHDLDVDFWRLTSWLSYTSHEWLYINEYWCSPTDFQNILCFAITFPIYCKNCHYNESWNFQQLAYGALIVELLYLTVIHIPFSFKNIHGLKFYQIRLTLTKNNNIIVLHSGTVKILFVLIKCVQEIL